MTIETETSQVNYAGDGVTTTFAYTFMIFNDEDLAVVLVDDTSGVEDAQVLTTDYSVTGAGEDTGGNVVFVTEPASGKTVFISRAVALKQETDYLEGDMFPASAHENALDYLTMICQQLNTEIERCLKNSLLASGVDGTLPVPSAGAAIGWNSGEDGFANIVSPGSLSVTTFGQALVESADAQAARTTLDTEDIHALGLPTYWSVGHNTNGTHKFGRGHIDGLILSNDTDADHDIAVSVGECRDAGDAYELYNDAVMTKQIDANWAAGDDAGGFPSGLTLTADTWYRYFMIAKTDGTVDFGYDADAAAVNLLADATGYTLYRRIGFVLTDGSLNILPFFQHGNYYTWEVPLLITDTAPTASDAGESYTIGPPCVTRASMNVETVISSDAAGTTAVYLRSPSATDDTPAFNAVPLATGGLVINTSATETAIAHSTYAEVFTDSNGAIKGSVEDANSDLYIAVLGYEDLRGRE